MFAILATLQLRLKMSLFFTQASMKQTQTLYIFLLFSRDKYIRPYEKSTLIQELEMNVIHDLTFDVEFSELEQLGKQKSQENY